MATLPSVPTFTFQQDPSLAVLNQLAYCVTFLNTLPAYGVFTASQNVVTATSTALTWAKTTDRDGGWAAGSPTRYTAQTPGYYDCSATASVPGSLTGARQIIFQVTTGSGNPGGSGNTTIFGNETATASNLATTSQVSVGAVSPYLYVGDFVQVFYFQNSGSTVLTTGFFQIALIGLGP